MKKFKPGDKVICLKSYSGSFTKGSIYTITNRNLDCFSPPYINVATDDSGRPNGWCEEYFMLAEKYIAEQEYNKEFEDFIGDLG